MRSLVEALARPRMQVGFTLGALVFWSVPVAGIYLTVRPALLLLEK